MFFLNNFPGIISSRGRYTMAHVGAFKSMKLPPQHTPEKLGFGIIFYNLKHLNTFRNSLNLPIPGLALPKAIPSLSVFARKPFAGNANAVVWGIMQFGQCCQPFFCSVLASTIRVQGTTVLSQYFLESFGWQWREYGRNRGMHARWGKCLGEGQVECHFVGFPQGRNYSDAWHPSKTKVGSCHNHQTSPEPGKNCQQAMKTKHFPLSHSFPLWPTKVLWITMKGIWKK